MIILGVDPGSLRTGYGVIETDGRRHALLEKGVVAPRAALPLAERLHVIHCGIAGVIARVRPDALAVEDVFHAANTRSALVLGHVRGAVLLAGAAAGIPVTAFPPATVKVQVTGFGRAEKVPGRAHGGPDPRAGRRRRGRRRVGRARGGSLPRAPARRPAPPRPRAPPPRRALS